MEQIKKNRYNKNKQGAVKVSTGWLKRICDAGREWVSSRKSRLNLNIDAKNNIVNFKRVAVTA